MMKRPLEAACRSHPICASTIGLRGNATAIAVPSLMRSVCSAASSKGKNGSCAVSAVHKASKPIASAAFACAATSCRLLGINPVSSFTVHLLACSLAVQNAFRSHRPVGLNLVHDRHPGGNVQLHHLLAAEAVELHDDRAQRVA